MQKILKFFDRLEDRVRAKLSHHPVLYSLIGGTMLVVFWEGVTIVVSAVPFFNTFIGGLVLMFVSISVLLLIGVFVSFFIGDTIIISGLNQEKKVIEKTEEENREESQMMSNMNRKINEIETIVKDLDSKIK
jgi:hypothetical protein